MGDKEIRSELEGFQPVNRGFKIIGGSRTGSAAVTVETTGLADTNLKGRELIDTLLKASGIEKEKAMMLFHANIPKLQVAVEIVEGGIGAMPYRRYQNRVSFHLGGTFEEHEELRPSTTVECPLFLTPSGKYLIINLAAQKIKRTTKRGDSAESADSADGNKKAAKVAKKSDEKKQAEPAAGAAPPEEQ